jgi:site-specific recombinase XerD
MKIVNELQIFQLLAVINPRSAFGERDHAMVRLALQTGLRVGELSALNVVQVAAAGVPREFLDLPAGITKYHTSRVVPLSPGAQRAVAEILAFNRKRGFSVEPEAALLQNRFHRRLSVRAIQKLVEGYRDQARLDIKATPHTLRHTMATNFVKHSGNLLALREAMGWKRLDTALIYLHPDREAMAKDFQTLPDTQ